ncbi:cation transporter dimerization domain-containing protein [Thiocystis violacea]|uniref:cation transporter dimerization domain-containing protein n=1 Tax=Thiocystis violacea TaxID=13725 RepID=UPI0023EE56C3|nr:cation transporter dimerization domain-containing protein [Thiocystis violacea]
MPGITAARRFYPSSCWSGSWELGWEATNELVDTGLALDRIAEVAQTIRSVGGVCDIHMLRTRRSGGQASADVHVLVDPYAASPRGT